MATEVPDGLICVHRSARNSGRVLADLLERYDYCAIGVIEGEIVCVLKQDERIPGQCGG